MAEVKFCGLTRADDARVGASIGAAYLGVVFAGGPRRLDAERACAVLDGARGVGRARRVGVFGEQPADEIIDTARGARLDVLQLHGGADAEQVRLLRSGFDGEIWRVVRVRAGAMDDLLRDAAADVDAVLVDALVAGALGGAGVAVDWESLAAAFARVGRPSRLVLAGGLRAENVARAIGLVLPDVVDVSSGVESAVGIKDHAMMRAFAEAAARREQ